VREIEPTMPSLRFTFLTVGLITILGFGLHSLLFPPSLSNVNVPAESSFRSLGQPESNVELRPLRSRIAYVKVPKTGSTSFAFVLDNAAKRRRLMALIWYEKNRDQCNPLRSSTYVRNDTIDSDNAMSALTCPPQKHFEPEMRSLPPPEPAYVAVNHVSMYSDKLAQLRRWYHRQMNGPNTDGTGLPPITMVASFRDPWNRFQSAFKQFKFDEVENPSLSAQIRNSGSLRGQASYLGGPRGKQGLQKWWKEMGADMLWLTIDDMSNSLLLLAHTVGLELFEIISLPTQVSSKYLAKRTDRSEEEVMAVTEADHQKAMQLLQADVDLVHLANQSYIAQLAQAQQEVGMEVWQARVATLQNMTQEVAIMCDERWPEYPMICRQLRGGFVQRVRSGRSIHDEFDLYAQEVQEWAAFLRKRTSG
jgi:hypothetical protein